MLRDVARRFATQGPGRVMFEGLDADLFSLAPEHAAPSFDARPLMEQKLFAPESTDPKDPQMKFGQPGRQRHGIVRSPMIE